MGLFDFFKKKQHAPSYYRDYPESPYVSPDRDMKDWNKKVSMFPDMMVKREMMIRDDDGLLPGHVYMLYWINKYKNKEIPVYFEYKYGINYNKELEYLKKRDLIDAQNMLTSSGNTVIANNKKIIEDHSDPTGQKRALTKKVVTQNYREPEAYDAFSLYTIGNELYHQQEYEEAEKYLLASVNKNNDAPALYNRLAILYRKQKRYQDEIDILERGKSILRDAGGNYHPDTFIKIEKRIQKANDMLDKNTDRIK